MIIRPFQPTKNDYEARVAIQNLVDLSRQVTIPFLQEIDADLSAENRVVQVIGELDRQIIAYGAYWRPMDNENKTHQFSLLVHPDYQNSSLPSQLQAYLISKLKEANPASIASEAKENETYRIQLLAADNFELNMRFPRSQLNVSVFDATDYKALTTKLMNEGIEFITLTDVMKRDENWQKNIWQLFITIDQDVPYPDPQQSVSFEEYATYYEGELFRPNSWAIAVDSTQKDAPKYVGMSVVNIMRTRSDALYAGITGTIPSYRRRKIATMLKVQSAIYAQQQGYHYIETDNEENNPMYQLNLQLGFQPLPAWVYYKKQLK